MKKHINAPLSYLALDNRKEQPDKIKIALVIFSVLFFIVGILIGKFVL